MVVNPETKRPIPPSVIDKALQEIHFSLKANRSTKQQVKIHFVTLKNYKLWALEAVPKLREMMKIERAKMRIRISMPAKDAKLHHSKLKGLFAELEVEDWAESGLEMVSFYHLFFLKKISIGQI